MNHTPTPWEWEWDGKPCGDEHYGLLKGQDGVPVLEVDDQTDERIVVTAANARLIAAAPDLLEACERLLKYDATCRDDDCQELNDIRARAKDAIAKATRP